MKILVLPKWTSYYWRQNRALLDEDSKKGFSFAVRRSQAEIFKLLHFLLDLERKKCILLHVSGWNVVLLLKESLDFDTNLFLIVCRCFVFSGRFPSHLTKDVLSWFWCLLRDFWPLHKKLWGRLNKTKLLHTVWNCCWTEPRNTFNFYYYHFIP